MPDTPVFLKSAVDQFLDAMAQRGITPPAAIIADGALHRFSSNGKPDDDAGWYVFHGGEILSGAFGDFRAGIKVNSWVADRGRSWSPTERSEFEKKQRQIQVEKKAKREHLQEQAQQKATCILRSATPADENHPYLVRKGIKPFGLSVWDDAVVTFELSRKTAKPFLQVVSKIGQVQVGLGLMPGSKSTGEICENWKSVLIIPMRDESGEIQSVQFIARNGEKKFLYGGKMQGCYFTLGHLRDSETILIAEGYATAATVHEITGHPTVVAFNAGNLLSVAQTIRARKPDAAIFLCADDDFKTKDNPGMTNAAQAAFAVSGSLLIPNFGANRPEEATDFNDMASHLGREVVTRFFYQALFGNAPEDQS